MTVTPPAPMNVSPRDVESKGPSRETVFLDPSEQPVPIISNLRDELAQQLVPSLKALSDITRLRLFLVLSACKEMNVRDLCKTVEKNQPTVSHHLSLMRQVNLVTTRIDGKNHYYRIVPEQIEKLIAHIFKTNVGHAGYLQFPKFQVEYHPRDKGILPTQAADVPTEPNTSLRDTI
jgi:DNA-binding transcriptional ArsR family regulator